jgi:N-acetylmuramoyl-L-alanine amidase
MSDGKVHVITQGESVESVAFENGHLWQTLWNHSENTELKLLRKDPHVLYPQDRLFVPDLRLREETCSTDARHAFVRKGVPSKLRVVVLHNNQPCARQPYVLNIDGQVFQGNTAVDGSVEHSIPPNAMRGSLIVLPGKKQRVYALQLGGLDPIAEISGIQGRLRNLGFPITTVDGQPGPETTSALQMFQEKYQLPVTGNPDSATQDKLKAVHGC